MITGNDTIAALNEAAKELKMLYAEIAILHEEMAAVVAAYDEANPIRTGNMHKEDCKCLRCAVDHIRY